MIEMALEILVVYFTLVVLGIFRSALCYPSLQGYVHAFDILVVDIRVSSEFENFRFDAYSHAEYNVWIGWHTATTIMFGSG